MKVLSCGAGMQSTALALMSCENKIKGIKHPLVPIYDAILFCDLGEEPTWVYNQVEFIKNACENAKIEFYVLTSNLYDDYMNKFGTTRVVSIPFWSIDENGKKGKMQRNCTIEYKITIMASFVKHTLLKYKRWQRIPKEDLKIHEMHIGFSTEEAHRCKENPHPLFVNKYPLIEMGLERKDNYKYILEVWGLETKASACTICPFHRNYYYQYIKEHHKEDFKKAVDFDTMLKDNQPKSKIKSQLFISRSRKRIKDLTIEDCNDKETFDYNGVQIWNGF